MDAVLYQYNNPKPRGMFYIYTNEYLTTPVESNQQSNMKQVAMVFDGFFSFDYTAETNIPWQPLEGGSFSSDCVQEMPSLMRIIAVRSPRLTSAESTAQTILDELADCEERMQKYLRNTTLLTIIKGYPLFRNYPNYKINKFNFKFDENVNKIVADMVFQEMRVNRGDIQNVNVADPQLQQPDNLGQITIQDNLTGDISTIDSDVITPIQ